VQAGDPGTCARPPYKKPGAITAVVRDYRCTYESGLHAWLREKNELLYYCIVNTYANSITVLLTHMQTHNVY
jgi:hypothetical protein